MSLRYLGPLAVLLLMPFGVSAAALGGKCERLVATGSPDAPPYAWQDPDDPRHLIGANVDLLQQAAAALGIKVEVLSTGRREQALQEVRSGRMDLLVDAPLQVAQLNALDYLHPAVQPNEYRVWVRADAPLAFDGPAELATYRGSLSAKARISPAFEAFAKARLHLEPAQNLTQAFQQLTLGKVDYVLAGEFSGLAMAHALGVVDTIVPQGEPVDRPGLYLAISHNSACNDPWLRGQLQKKLTELPISGVSQAVLQHNVARWKAQLQTPTDAPQP